MKAPQVAPCALGSHSQSHALHLATETTGASAQSLHDACACTLGPVSCTPSLSTFWFSDEPVSTWPRLLHAQIMVGATAACLTAGRMGLAPTVKKTATAGLTLVEREVPFVTGDPAGAWP